MTEENEFVDYRLNSNSKKTVQKVSLSDNGLVPIVAAVFKQTTNDLSTLEYDKSDHDTQQFMEYCQQVRAVFTPDEINFIVSNDTCNNLFFQIAKYMMLYYVNYEKSFQLLDNKLLTTIATSLQLTVAGETRPHIIASLIDFKSQKLRGLAYEKSDKSPLQTSVITKLQGRKKSLLPWRNKIFNVLEYMDIHASTMMITLDDNRQAILTGLLLSMVDDLDQTMTIKNKKFFHSKYFYGAVYTVIAMSDDEINNLSQHSKTHRCSDLSEYTVKLCSKNSRSTKRTLKAFSGDFPEHPYLIASTLKNHLLNQDRKLQQSFWSKFRGNTMP